MIHVCSLARLHNTVAATRRQPHRDTAATIDLVEPAPHRGPQSPRPATDFERAMRQRSNGRTQAGGGLRDGVVQARQRADVNHRVPSRIAFFI